MENCPVCKTPITDPVAKECPKCGVIFEKWQAKVAAAVVALQRSREPIDKKFRWVVRLGSILVVAIGLTLMAMWPTDRGPSDASSGQVSREGPAPSVGPTEEGTATPTPSGPMVEGTSASDP